MKKDNNVLYEKIMHNISKSLKYILNEDTYNFDIVDYQDEENDPIDNHILNQSLNVVKPKTLKELKKIVAERISKNPENPNLYDIDTSLITNMTGLFSDQVILDKKFNNYNDSYSTFNQYFKWYGIESEQIKNLSLASFNTSNVSSMAYMFNNCKWLENINLSSFDTSNVADMSGMFNECQSLVKIDLSNFDTSNVTDMSYMFKGCMSLNELDLTKFDTSYVNNMRSMFERCHSLTKLDLSSFNTINVRNMDEMFFYCDNLIKLDLSGFDTSNVINMTKMFAWCKALPKLDLSNFNMMNTDETTCAHMFLGCDSLKSTQLKIFR